MKDCIIVIPVYRKSLDRFERNSLRNTSKVLSKWDMAFVCPENFEFGDDYVVENDKKISIERFDDRYFKSRNTYSDLCETSEFYERFSQYRYMLICQLDAWVFEDRLKEFIDMGYDYIGSPHETGKNGDIFNFEVGNGGFSLRNVSKFAEICRKTDFSRFGKVWEDIVFSRFLKNEIKVAKIEDAFKFGWQQKPELALISNGGNLPFGTHRPFYYAYDFWKDKIHIDDCGKKPYIVVIPYLESAAQGNELRLAIEGWERYFKEDFIIVIVGESLNQKFEYDNIRFVKSKRVQPVMGMYRQHLDYVSCFKKVRKAFPESDGFIFVADDCYAVNEFTIEDIKLPKATSNDMEVKNITMFSNGWADDQNRTKRILVENGYPFRNYTTHIPIWFEWDKLFELYKRFGMEKNSYVVENLYYNIYGEEEPYMHSPMDKYRFFIRSSSDSTPKNVSYAFGNTKWIANSVNGWSKTLEGFLKQRYHIH